MCSKGEVQSTMRKLAMLLAIGLLLGGSSSVAVGSIEDEYLSGWATVFEDNCHRYDGDTFWVEMEGEEYHRVNPILS
jgi:hypothetical protein